MTQIPKISILIATHNQDNYILQAVNSCLAQDYKNLEIIVGDDSTNIHTQELLECLISRGEIVYFQNESNLGRVRNYRKLLYEFATGDWVVMLDGDDYYVDTNYISKVAEQISKSENIVMVSSGHIKIDEKSGIRDIELITSVDTTFNGKDFFTSFTKMPQHSTNVYNRVLAMQLNFYSHPSNASDAEGLYKLVLFGDVVFLHGAPVVWRIHEANTTFSRSVFQQVRELDFIDSIHAFSISYVGKTVADQWKFDYYRGMYHVLNGIAYTTNNLFLVCFLSYRARHYWGRYSLINLFIYVKIKLKKKICEISIY